MSPERNPDWTREELILALEAHFLIQEGASKTAIAESLSAELNQLPIHPGHKRANAFRSPDGVRTRLDYFQRRSEGVELPQLIYREVWDEFAHRPVTLAAAAEAVRRRYMGRSVSGDDISLPSSGRRAPQAGYTTRLEQDDNEDEGSPAIGIPYRPAPEDVAISKADPFSVDPALVERGVKGHARTQNLLAAYVDSCGAEPRSPAPDDPNFDLAWKWNGVLYVAEVKSLTAANEEKQLRLGLGQVIRYQHILGSEREVRAVLAVERAPSDDSWQSLCTSHSVQLVWPDSFGTLGP